MDDTDRSLFRTTVSERILVPKLVDPDKRRREIAEALWRLAERDGFGAVSVRNVAREAGWSAGALRYSFSTQEELLRFAMESMIEAATARIQAVLDAAPRADDPVNLAVRLLEQALPFDPRRAAEVSAWRAINEAVREYPGLHDVLETEWSSSRHLCRLIVVLLWDLVENAAPDVPLANDAAELQAGLLLALWDGFSYRSVSRPADFPPETMRAMLRAWLAQTRSLKPPAR